MGVSGNQQDCTTKSADKSQQRRPRKTLADDERSDKGNYDRRDADGDECSDDDASRRDGGAVTELVEPLKYSHEDHEAEIAQFDAEEITAEQEPGWKKEKGYRETETPECQRERVGGANGVHDLVSEADCAPAE